MIDWLVSLAGDCPALGVGRPPGFLSEPERETLATLRFDKRRREWLLGRWTAKRLLKLSRAKYRTLSMQAITVGNDPDGAPYLSVAGEGRLPLSLSISHRQDRAFCALSPSLPPLIGADIERIEPRDPAFVSDFFTADEAERVWTCPPSMRDMLITTIWSAKEAALKALRHGLRIDTRRIQVRHVSGIEADREPVSCPVSEAWHELRIGCTLPDATSLSAWWRPEGEYVLTLAATLPNDRRPRLASHSPDAPRGGDEHRGSPPIQPT